MKIKHNKKRNTLFLYEVLIREMTKCVLESNKERQKQIMEILKKYFNAQTILNEEIKLYRSILETRSVGRKTAERLLEKTEEKHSFLNKEKIFEVQSRLIKQVNKQLGMDVYMNYVPNYKHIATVHQILSGKLDPKSQIMMENEIVDYMCSKEEKEEIKEPIDKLSYKMFYERFNEKYGKELNEHQKKLLNHYLTSYNDNGLEIKMYIEEETLRLTEIIKKRILEKEELRPKLTQVIELFEKLKQKQQINEVLLTKLLQIQRLVEELDSDQSQGK